LRAKESSKVPLAVLLLFTVLGSTLVIFPPPVLAQKPYCGDTLTANTTLTADMGPCSGNGLVIGANGITLNCAGHKISGTGTSDGSPGISIHWITGVTLENCNVESFNDGVLTTNSSGDLFLGNSASFNSVAGFNLGSVSAILTGNEANHNGLDGFDLSSSTSTLAGNAADYDYYGFLLTKSSGDTVTNNTANGNAGIGFTLFNSSRVTLRGNTADNTGICCFGMGFELSSSSDDKLTSNTADGNGVLGFWLWNSNSSTLIGNTANDDKYFGFDLGISSNDKLTANTADGNGNMGFDVAFFSNLNTLSGNTASGNDYDGFYLYTNSSVFSGNTADGNKQYGFFLDSSWDDTLRGNTADYNYQYGYFDNTTGSGTAGTANLYPFDECSGNYAGGSSPAGLCTPPLSRPTISASPTLVGQGQSATLSVTEPFIGGNSPFTCQWLEKPPTATSFSSLGSSFTTGCTRSSRPTVSTGALVTLGTWMFELQVRDATGTTVVSLPVKLTVRAPTVTSVLCTKSSFWSSFFIACTATVTGTYSSHTGTITWSKTAGPGRVTFSSKTCRLVGGRCSVKVMGMAAGNVTIEATYSGDSNNLKSAGTRVLTLI
jgi:parallel beta-helix repeat protein